MRLHELIVPGAVLPDLKAHNKSEALNELLEALVTANRLSCKEDALTRLEQRESAGTTGVGDNVAVPHASIPSVRQPVIAIGKSVKGIDFNAPDSKVANIIFLLLGPSEGIVLHLKILARIARLLAEEGFVDTVKKTKTAESLIAFIRENENSLGDIKPPEDMPSVCIAGAGNGGLAMAAHAVLLGCRVNLYNRSEERISFVRMNEGIYAVGEVTGYAKLNRITTDPAKALEGMDIVMVVAPATAHRDIAMRIGPHLRDGQVVVLNPGRTGGALEFAEVLRQLKVHAHPFIGEAETLLYACRVINPAQVKIFAIKNSVPMATIPAYHIPDVLPNIRRIFPQFVPGDNVLKTSLSNIGSVFHPALTILNAAWIEERHGDFDYYHEGASQSVSGILETLDAERVAIAAAIGIKVPTAREWLYLAYGAAGTNLHEAIQSNIGYSGIKAPNTTDHRYITEDVPTSLVPMASLGEQLGVPVPTIKTFIHLANILHGRDYWKEGRTVDRLGLRGLSVKQIRRLVEEGDID